MNWNDLIAEITAVGSAGTTSAPIAGIEYDSRRVTPGAVFVAMKGGSTDGNRFVDKAIAAGALAIITDSAQTFDHLLAYHPGLPVLEVEHGRHALAQASGAFFGHPERKLAATGITGTNGKTTTAFLAESLLNAASRSTVLIGTIEYHVAGEVRSSIHTTPESRDLFELMAKGVSRGATELVTEVSSHALDQGRMAGIPFDVAVFTNLTRDHLDYHHTMDNYFAAKRLLFDGTVYPAPHVAVINAHDPRSEDLAAAARKAGAEIRTYGIGIGDWRVVSYQLTPAGAVINLETPAGSAQLISRLAGEVNILNLLAALSAAHARGVSFSSLVAAVPTLAPVPGRFQPVHAGQPFTVIVDYAHTDDALRNLTTLARKMTSAPGTPDDPGPPEAAPSPTFPDRASSLSSAAAATATVPSARRWASLQAKVPISSSPLATIPAPKIPPPSLLKSSPACSQPASITPSRSTAPRPFASPFKQPNPVT